MRGKLIVAALGFAWLSLVGSVGSARGDGGSLQISELRKDRTISVFTSPTPLRVGAADASILVKHADAGESPADSKFVVRAWPLSKRQNVISAPATHEAATNKLMQAAQLTFSEAGWWRVEVTGPDVGAKHPLGFDVEVLKAFPRWLELSPWILWPLVPIGLYMAYRLRTGKRRSPMRSRRNVPLYRTGSK
jgi:hypothetical protein